MNAFESGDRKVIPAVLIYVFAQDKVLMIHRNRKPGDIHAGKWNGLGGKLELDESPPRAAQRELWEEARLDLSEDSFRPLGVLQFPNFKPSQDWWVTVFRVDLPGPASEPWQDCPEGELAWVPAREVLDLPLWEGDVHFLPKVLARRPFIGTFCYRNNALSQYQLTEITI